MTFPRKFYRFEYCWPIGETGKWSEWRRPAFDKVFETAKEAVAEIHEDAQARNSAGILNPLYRIVECSESVIEEGRS